jgi:hypothetical protein
VHRVPKEGGRQLVEVGFEVVVVLRALYLKKALEPKVGEVLTLRCVPLVVEVGSRSDKLLLFVVVALMHVLVPHLLLLLLVRLRSLQLHTLELVRCRVVPRPLGLN